QSKISTTTETTEYMHKIAEYCIVDAKSSQRLMVEKNMINDYRDVASIAYISLFDSHYYAIDMKVHNLLGAEAWKQDILVTMITKKTEKGSFPGAYMVYTLTEANALKKENKVLHAIEFEYLLNKRNEMKTQLKPLGKKIGHMGLVKSRINSEVSSIVTVETIKGILENIKDEKKRLD
ncbi:14995_t:CDS:2, partial [Cetraspora pellucida]